MAVCFLSNISAKYYKNPSMLSLVIAKKVEDVFLRHSVECACEKMQVKLTVGYAEVISFGGLCPLWNLCRAFTQRPC